MLEAKPGLFLRIRIHQSSSIVTVIELVWSSIVIPTLAQDQNVVATTEWVRIDGDRPEIDIRVAALRLAAG